MFTYNISHNQITALSTTFLVQIQGYSKTLSVFRNSVRLENLNNEELSRTGKKPVRSTHMSRKKYKTLNKTNDCK